MSYAHCNLPATLFAGLVILAPLEASAQVCTGEDLNSNEAYVLGETQLRKHLEFVYSSYNEPELVRSEGGGGENQVFQAILADLTKGPAQETGYG